MLICVAVLTVITSYTDLKFRKIPNKVTIPIFLLGIVWHVVFHWSDPGLILDGLASFAVGFGMLFILWLVGASAAGDVKFMGALSIWLGFKQLFLVLIVSIFVILIGTTVGFMLCVRKYGLRKTLELYKQRPKAINAANSGKSFQPIDTKKNPIFMNYAVPMSISTWLVLGWVFMKPYFRPDVPAAKTNPQQLQQPLNQVELGSN